MLKIFGGIGLAGSLASLVWLIIAHVRDKKKDGPIILFFMCFLLFAGSGFLYSAGFEIKLPSKDDADIVQEDAEKPQDAEPAADSPSPDGQMDGGAEPADASAPDQPENTDYEPTDGEANALGAAINYMSSMPFSREGLAAQLEFSGYSADEAAYGVDNCGADWSEQAVKKAKVYISTAAFSYAGLVKQLEFDKFTPEESAYGADNCSADWNEQAVRAAKSYLDAMSFSKEDLIRQLEFSGFTNEQAAYGAEENGF